eukprot:761032-Hanusia_phi.AAC.9
MQGEANTVRIERQSTGGGQGSGGGEGWGDENKDGNGPYRELLLTCLLSLSWSLGHSALFAHWP